MRYPRYVTYSNEELRDAIRQIDPTGSSGVTTDQLRLSGGTGGLLKSYSCPITYPDGAAGTCRYTRCGPSWHQFHYQHTGREGIVPISACSLPVQHFTSRMENTPKAIAAKAQELSTEAYQAAIQVEWKDHFKRALPSHRVATPAPAQMTAKRAKEISGKYALCLKLGEKLVPATDLMATMEEANIAWKERSDPRFLVACACRWSRRWEAPKFNPLYTEIDSQIT